MSFETWLKESKPVIPVIVIDEIEQAVPLAKALVAGGVRLLEVTLRTPVAFAAIEKIASEVPEAIVGVGTATNADHIQQAKDSGAQFALSPGISVGLIQKAQQLNMPFMPGVMTPSDIILGLDNGLSEFKFFPAQQAGGVNMLKAFSGPFPQVRFCPTGGISQTNYQEFLALNNVLAVGGSWLCSRDLMQSKDWETIEGLAQSL